MSSLPSCCSSHVSSIRSSLLSINSAANFEALRQENVSQKSLTSKLSHTALKPSPLQSETKMLCSGLLRHVTVNLRCGFWYQRHMPPFATSRIKNCATSREQRRLGQARSTRKTQRGTSSP